MTDVAAHPFTSTVDTPWRRRRVRYVRLWLKAILRRAARRLATRRARTARAWRRRQELLDMFALDDATLLAFGVTRAEIVIALEDGRRAHLPPHLAAALEARRRDVREHASQAASAR